MSAGIRGQEVTIRLTVDGQIQKGSFFKPMDFEVTTRGDLVERDFLGETASDLDTRYDGYDFRFSVEMQDQWTIDLLQSLNDREVDGLPPPDITVTVMYSFRESAAQPRTVVLRECVIMQKREGFEGRKEYLKSEWEGKAKKRSVING